MTFSLEEMRACALWLFAKQFVAQSCRTFSRPAIKPLETALISMYEWLAPRTRDLKALGAHVERRSLRVLRGHVLPAPPANCGALDEHGAKNCFSCEMMRCANQAGRVALGFELIEPLGSAQGTVISTPRAGLSAGSRCRGSRRRPNCTICGVRDVGEPDFHFGASRDRWFEIATLIGRIRRATTWSKQARTFDVLPFGSRRSLRAGRSSIRRGICRHRRQRSAVPGYRKVKVRRASDHLRLGPRRRSAASPSNFGQGFGCGPISRGVGAQKSVIAAPSAGVKVATESPR